MFHVLHERIKMLPAHPALLQLRFPHGVKLLFIFPAGGLPFFATNTIQFLLMVHLLFPLSLGPLPTGPLLGSNELFFLDGNTPPPGGHQPHRSRRYDQ
jgi:hypothetical protein